MRDTTLAKRAELKAATFSEAASLLRAIAKLRQEHRALIRSLAEVRATRARIVESISRLRFHRRDLKRKMK
jgi:hypothetical protein